MVEVELSAPPLAAVGPPASTSKPRWASAKRAWPHRCGRIPGPPPPPLSTDAGERDGDGVSEGKEVVAAAAHTVAPSASRDVILSYRRKANKEVKSLVAASEGCGAVVVANGLLENGRGDAAGLVTGEKGSGGGGELMRRKGGGGRGGSRKRWLVSVGHPPPKRRAVLAKHRFPYRCRTVPATCLAGSANEEGLCALETMVADNGVVDDRATPQANHMIQESLVAVNIVVDDSARGKCEGALQPTVVTEASARHGSDEGKNGKVLECKGKSSTRVVTKDDKVKSKCDGRVRVVVAGSLGRGPSDKRMKGKKMMNSDGMDGTRSDIVVGDSREDRTRHKTLSLKKLPILTPREVVRSPGKVKKKKSVMDTLHMSIEEDKEEEAKFGGCVAISQIEDNDASDVFINGQIVQALMSPDKYPLTQGWKSTASVAHSLVLKKKPKEQLSEKAANPSKLIGKEKLEDEEASSLEDYGSSKALNGHDGKLEFCGNIPPCVPFALHHRQSGDQNADARSKVRAICKRFQLICRKLVQAEEQHLVKVGRIDLAADKLIRKFPGFTKLGPVVGSVPGVEVGDEFQYRVELAIVGLHRLYQGGIDTSKENGVRIAISIVASGGYPDELSSSDELIYTGSGGKPAGKKESEDQKLERGNLALKNCIKTQTPVRVIHGFKGQSRGEAGHSSAKQFSVFTYDGLYVVVDCWQEGLPGSRVFKYKLQRIPGQPKLALHIVKETRKSKVRAGLCLPDISEGKESIPISVINTIDNDRPAQFKYITKIIYPSWYAEEYPQGCDCTNGCSDSASCACAVKNGGEIPYNFNGAIVHAKPLIFECGPSCRCPPTCHNRVSQQGVKIPLEIFKTGNTGWGVRSLRSISSGSFICEYIGELLHDKEADQRTNDEYLFDIGHNYDDEDLWKGLPSIIPGLKNSISCSQTVEDLGFTIDAADFGNIGRFINHSCSPNLYAQNVLWDHGDKRMPHIMFFAAENIRPLQELTYHYNYTIGQVHDADGKEKVKYCHCGSPECSGRLY